MDMYAPPVTRQAGNRPSRPTSFGRRAAQAIAITCGLALTRARRRPEHAPTMCEDSDIEALAVGIGVLRPAVSSSSTVVRQTRMRAHR
ncbi:hypothetical protein [Streptomyces sp. NEAU-174]|uniref:hypothetical protein n=1 Tax=Streptomyces sp. NEAU-174 TaxID=3458254 RepID=UPI004043AF7C